MSEENALPGQEVTLTAMPTVDDVIEAMKDVIDPELMVNVVDLGLVYGVNIDGEGNVFYSDDYGLSLIHISERAGKADR